MGAARPVCRGGGAVVGNRSGHRAGHLTQLLRGRRLGAHFFQRGAQLLHWQQRPVRRDCGDSAGTGVGGTDRAAARGGRRDPAFGPIPFFLCPGLGLHARAARCLPKAAAIQVVPVLARRRDWPQSRPLLCPPVRAVVASLALEVRRGIPLWVAGAALASGIGAELSERLAAPPRTLVARVVRWRVHADGGGFFRQRTLSPARSAHPADICRLLWPGALPAVSTEGVPRPDRRLRGRIFVGGRVQLPGGSDERGGRRSHALSLGLCA